MFANIAAKNEEISLSDTSLSLRISGRNDELWEEKQKKGRADIVKIKHGGRVPFFSVYPTKRVIPTTHVLLHYEFAYTEPSETKQGEEESRDFTLIKAY